MTNTLTTQELFEKHHFANNEQDEHTPSKIIVLDDENDHYCFHYMKTAIAFKKEFEEIFRVDCEIIET